jgi:hypothetical protein
VLTTTWGWQNKEGFLQRQAELPSASGLFSTPDGEAWSFDRKMTDYLFDQRDLCRERGQLFLGYDILFWGDDLFFPPRDRLFEFPYGIAAKMRRWAWLQTDGVFDQWGTAAELLASNAFALREFYFDPFQSAGPVVARIAERQYGDAAPAVLAAWREIEAAQQVQSGHTYYWHPLRHNWSAQLGIPPTLEALSPDISYARGEPHKPAGPIDHAPGDAYERAKRIGPALRRAIGHFENARVEFDRAIRELDLNRSSFYAGLVADVTPIAPVDQLRRQRQSVRLISEFSREIAHFYDAYALACDIQSASGEERGELVRRFRQLQDDVVEGTKQLRAFLSGIGVSDNHQMMESLRKRMEGI